MRLWPSWTRRKALVGFAALISALILAGVISFRDVAQSKRLLLTADQGGMLGYDIQVGPTVSGKIVTEVRLITPYLVAYGSRNYVPLHETRLDITNSTATLWLPRSPFPGYIHEVHVIRQRLFYIGDVGIPIWRFKEVWVSERIMNEAASSGIVVSIPKLN